MRKNKKKNMMLLLLLLVLGVTVGYAFLNTTLNINGTSKIGNAKWNVYWDNPQVTTGSVTTTKPTIDSAKTTATFDITLNNPKDFYEFTIDAVNAGTIDAMIKVNGVSNKVYSDSGRTEETTLPDAIKYTVTYADGTEIAEKHLLAKKSGDTPTRETYKVRIEYRNDEQTTAQDLEEITEETTYYMTFSVEYVQAENAIEAHPTSAITYITRQNEGQITPGDVIGIGETEDFYVVSSNSEKTVLLAKYNLLVGYWSDYDDDYPTNSPYEGNIPTNFPGYGLQSAEAFGYTGGLYYGTITFYHSAYWGNGDYGEPDIISPYNVNGASYDGNPYPYVYDENSNVYKYISGENGYVNRLISMGAPSSIVGRLLTYEEAENMQNLTDNGISIIFDQYYWLGSAADNDVVWGIYGYGFQEFWSGYNSDSFCGVRPVIEIPTSALQ